MQLPGCTGKATQVHIAPVLGGDHSKATMETAVAVCASCHDSTDAQAHINVQTDSMGNESCGICHGPGKDEDVERVHKAY